MTQDDLKLVLDALKWCHGGEPCGTAEAIAVVEKALAQEQEPVAWTHQNRFTGKTTIIWDLGLATPNQNWNPLYTHPHRTWVGLTDDEIDAIYTGVRAVHREIDSDVFARAIEAKLKEKNNG